MVIHPSAVPMNLPCACRSTANEVALKMAFRKFRHDHAEELSGAVTSGQDMELHVSAQQPAQMLQRLCCGGHATAHV